MRSKQRQKDLDNLNKAAIKAVKVASEDSFTMGVYALITDFVNKSIKSTPRGFAIASGDLWKVREEGFSDFVPQAIFYRSSNSSTKEGEPIHFLTRGVRVRLLTEKKALELVKQFKED